MFAAKKVLNGKPENTTIYRLICANLWRMVR